MAKITQDLESWNVLIEEISKSAPRLNFLNSASLGQLLVVLEEVLTPQHIGNKENIFSIVSPFLWICFPELLTLESAVLKPDLVYSAIKQAYTSVVRPNQAVLRQQQILEVIKLFFTSLNASLDPEPVDRTSITVHLVTQPHKELGDTRITSNNLLVATVQITESLPHPSCVLRCKASTSESTLLRFIHAAEAFPSLCFVILGVNALGIHLRNKLLVELVRLEKTNTPVNLNLLFTERQGYEAFSFLTKNDIPHSELSKLAFDAASKIKPFFSKHHIKTFKVHNINKTSISPLLRSTPLLTSLTSPFRYLISFFSSSLGSLT